MNVKRNPLKAAIFQGANQERNVRLYYSMVNANENENSLLNDAEFEDRRNQVDEEMSDEAIEALLGELDDDDGPNPARKPVKIERVRAKAPTPSPAIKNIQDFDDGHYLKRFAKIGETPSKKKFTGALEQEFEHINEVLTLRKIAPTLRNFQKFNKVEYKHEAQKGRYGIAEQKANLYWLLVHHRETVLELCSADVNYECILDFFRSDEYDDDLAHEIATLEGNIDYSKGRQNHLGGAKKCELLGLPDYIQRELSVFHSPAIKKEKQREAKEKQKEVGKIAKQERESAERLRENKIKLANDRHKLEKYREANPLRNKQDSNLDEVWNVRLAMFEVGDDSKKRSAAMSIYKKLTGEALSPTTFSRRIDYLKKAFIL